MADDRIRDANEKEPIARTTDENISHEANDDFDEDDDVESDEEESDEAD